MVIKRGMEKFEDRNWEVKRSCFIPVAVYTGCRCLSGMKFGFDRVIGRKNIYVRRYDLRKFEIFLFYS